MNLAAGGTALHEGAAARLRGVQKRSNYYPAGTALADAWDRGWDAAAGPIPHVEIAIRRGTWTPKLRAVLTVRKPDA